MNTDLFPDVMPRRETTPGYRCVCLQAMMNVANGFFREGWGGSAKCYAKTSSFVAIVSRHLAFTFRSND